MTPAQSFFYNVGTLILNYWSLGLVGAFWLYVYLKYLRVNRDTDNIDLMGRYIWLQLRRRYGPKI